MDNKALELSFNFSDLKKLTIPGILGHYSGYKITTIVASRHKESHNLLTIISAVEEPIVTSNDLKCTFIDFKKLEEWRYAIAEHFIDLNSLEQVLTEALNHHFWEANGGRLLFGNLCYCGHWYVPSYLHTCGKISPISKMVSNGGDIGAHVWEWGVGEQGVFSDFFETPPLLRELSKKVSEITKFDLDHVSDRLGNILISLPVTSINCEFQGIPDTLDGIRVKPVWTQGIPPQTNNRCREQNKGWHDKPANSHGMPRNFRIQKQ